MKFRHNGLPTASTKLAGMWMFEVVVVTRDRCCTDNTRYCTVSMSKQPSLEVASEIASTLNSSRNNASRDYVVAMWQMVEGELQLRLTRDPILP